MFGQMVLRITWLLLFKLLLLSGRNVWETRVGKEQGLLAGMGVQPGLCLKMDREFFQKKKGKIKK